MFVQIVDIEVLPEQRSAFLAAFRVNIEGSRKEPGNLRFDLLADPENPNLFIVYEIFESEAALQAHRETDHFRHTIALINPMMARPRTKRILDAVIIERPDGSFGPV